MGKPTVANPTVMTTRIHSVSLGTQGSETSKYLKEKKVN